MKRSLAILLVAFVAGAAVFTAAYAVSQCVCAKQLAKSADNLDWLRQEFRLSEPEMARIRELHNGYLPECHKMCAQIAAKKSELAAVLEGTTNVPAAADQKLAELAALRAECQSQMLRHFAQVSQAMPAEQGKRYLAEMKRVTLGFHEQIEQSMSDSADHAHGHE